MDLLSIQELYEQNQLKEAYTAIQAFTQANPSDKAGLQLQEQILHTVRKQNQLKIDSEIGRIRELIKAEKFQEALAIALKLKEFAPENQELLNLISQTYKNAQKQIANSKADFQTQIIQKVSELNKLQRYPEALKLIEDAYNQTKDPRLQQLSLNTRNEYVSYKLKANEAAMKQLPPERVTKFLDDLAKISPKNEDLKRLQLDYNQKQQQQKIVSRKHYIKEAQRQIKILFFQGKYDKSIQACLELSKADPKNKIARKFFTKNNKAIEKESHKQAYSKLKDYIKKLKLLSSEQIKAQYDHF